MAESIALVGPSGSGKTYSLRKLDPKETFIFSPYKTSPALPGGKKNYKKFDVNAGTGNFMLQPSMSVLGGWVKYVAENLSHIKYIVIEDFSHYMTHYLMSDEFRSKAGGKLAYSRFEEFAADAYSALFMHTPNLRDDLTLIYIFHDDEIETMTGSKRKFRVTAGKMLDEKVDLPSYFNYVIFTEVLSSKELSRKERFVFRVVNDGHTPAKLPYGVYPEEVETVSNEITDVIKHINAYNEGESNFE